MHDDFAKTILSFGKVCRITRRAEEVRYIEIVAETSLSRDEIYFENNFLDMYIIIMHDK
jgi:hypothetical protein